MQIGNQEIKLRENWNKNVSIEERKKKGYWQLPKRTGIEIHNNISDESFTSEEQFWRNNISESDSSTPLVVDKQSDIRFSEFSRMLHKSERKNQEDGSSSFTNKLTDNQSE